MSVSGNITSSGECRTHEICFPVLLKILLNRSGCHKALSVVDCKDL